MNQDLLLQLRENVARNRPDLPQFPTYLGPWGLKARCEILSKDGELSPKIAKFDRIVTLYLETGNRLLEAQLFSPSQAALRELLPYCLDAVNDVDCIDAMKVVDILSHFLDAVALKPDEEIVVLYIIILGYRRDTYPWRGRKYALRLNKLLYKRAVPMNIYDGLALWYKTVLDFASASEISLFGAKRLLEEGKKKQAAWLCRDGLVSATYVPNFDFPSKERIKAQYGEFAGMVLDYSHSATLKRDPVEASEEFQDVYDQVMEEAMAKYLAEPEPKVIHILWAFMAEALRKRGIEWVDPQRLNPTARFD